MKPAVCSTCQTPLSSSPPPLYLPNTESRWVNNVFFVLNGSEPSFIFSISIRTRTLWDSTSSLSLSFFTCLCIDLKQIPASACNWRSSLPPSGLDSSALHVCRVRAGHLPRRPSPLCLRPAASDAPPEVQQDLSSPLGAGAEQTEHKQISTAGRGGWGGRRGRGHFGDGGEKGGGAPKTREHGLN